MRYVKVLAAMTLAFASSAAEASKLLYRAYDASGVLYGAMVYDTTTPLITGGDDPVIAALAFSGKGSGVSTSQRLFAGFNGGGSSAFGRGAVGVFAPGDQQLYTGASGDQPQFLPGTYHLYAPATDPRQPTTSYQQTATIQVEDVSDRYVNIFAQTGTSPGLLRTLIVTFGAEPDTGTPAGGGVVFLRNFEGSSFDASGNAATLRYAEFLETNDQPGRVAFRTNATEFYQSARLYGGTDNNPSFFYTGEAFNPASAAVYYRDSRGAPDRLYLLQSAPVPPTVPEPATWGLMLIGFGLMGARARRRSTAITFA